MFALMLVAILNDFKLFNTLFCILLSLFEILSYFFDARDRIMQKAMVQYKCSPVISDVVYFSPRREELVKSSNPF